MMKKIIRLCIIFCTLSSYSILTQWVSINSPTTSRIECINAVNQDMLFIGTSKGDIYKSTNRGVSWVPLTKPDTVTISDIYFLDGITGYVSFWQNSHGVYKTTNGGTNWVRILNEGTGDLFFPTSALGYSLRNTSPIFIDKTTNGGANYTTTVFNEYGVYYPTAIGAINPISMYVVCLNGASPDTSIVLKTINGGTNWGLISKIPGEDFTDISFANSNTGIMSGRFGALARTTNQGVNWTVMNSGTPFTLNAVIMNNSSNGYFIELTGKIFKTTNTGLNWVLQTSLPGELNDIAMFPGDTGYVVGNGGIIYKTTNGGVTAITQLSTQIPGDYSLKQNYPNPFNPSTNIRFSIPKIAVVKLTIYDALGRNIALLINENLSAGEYETTFDAAGLPSGIYLYRIETAAFTETKKMILIK